MPDSAGDLPSQIKVDLIANLSPVSGESRYGWERQVLDMEGNTSICPWKNSRPFMPIRLVEEIASLSLSSSWAYHS